MERAADIREDIEVALAAAVWTVTVVVFEAMMDDKVLVVVTLFIIPDVDAVATDTDDDREEEPLAVSSAATLDVKELLTVWLLEGSSRSTKTVL